MIRFSNKNIEILDTLSKSNDPSFNFNKALEESNEFSEVLLKYQTKSNKNKPPKIEAIKEFGDLIYRGFVALKMLFPELSDKEIKEAISDRIDYKLDNLIAYGKSNQYKNNL